MAYIYKAESAGPPCTCRLHHADHSQVVDVYKLAQLGETRSIADFAEFSAAHPTLARLAEADAQAHHEATSLVGAYVAKQQRKALLTKAKKPKKKQKFPKRPSPASLAKQATAEDTRKALYSADPVVREWAWLEKNRSA